MILKTLAFPFLLGVNDSNKRSFNRVTIFTNAAALVAFVGTLGSYATLKNLGFSDSQIWYFKPNLCVWLATLTLNYFHQYWPARVLFHVGLILATFMALASFGKSFNGYYIFFVVVTYAIYAYSRLNPWLKYTAVTLSALLILLIDYLSHSKIFPVTGLNSADFSLSVLWIDSIPIVSGWVVLLLVEKNYSDIYETELEDFNKKLERKVQERTIQLLTAKEEAEAASLKKSQFVANTSHELRTPLQGILGNIDLAFRRLDKVPKSEDAEKPLSKVADSLTKARESSERLFDLITRLLEITTIDGDKLRTESSNFNFLDLIEQHVQRSEPQRFEMAISGDKTEFEVTTDNTFASQVIGNLFENALKYSETNTKIKLSLQLAGQNVVFRIQNQGYGIPEKETEAIFEPFFQSSRTDELVGGTGLGLTMSQKYAQTLGGHLKLTDASSQTTTFEFSFPKAAERTVNRQVAN
jgi:signal transduction histidine kinase